MKSGFAIIIGRSNVGKSTLINALVGSKVSITTNKPQTTRHIIHGIVNDERGQIVFVDTPGILKGSHSALTGQLVDRVREALHGIDVIVYVVDPTRSIGTEERYTLSLIRAATIPKIFVINKSDLGVKERPYLEDYRALGVNEFTHTIELSATTGVHTKALINTVFESLPEGEPLYPDTQRTNMRKEQWVAEIIREKVLHETRDEVPYAVHVVVDTIEEKKGVHGKPDMFVITARIVCSADRYKKMVIGAGGRIIKEIGSVARRELEQRLNSKIFLDLEVTSDANWMNYV